MATRNQQPDLTVLEYTQLVDAINAAMDRGHHDFDTQELADSADLTDAQVYEAMSHLSQKHEYITDAGRGSWRVDPVED